MLHVVILTTLFLVLSNGIPTFMVQITKFIRFTHISYALIFLLAFITVGCQESSNNENSVQRSLDTLLTDLQAATSGSNTEGLESVIASANRIKPVSQSQTQSKNLLLSTANEKLAQLTFQTLLAESTAMSSVFQLAKHQALQVSLLRKTADSLAPLSRQESAERIQEIRLNQNPKLDHFNSQLQEANSNLSQQDSLSSASRDEAEQLLMEADQLLIEAEEKGIVDGHAAYKSGARSLRKSQQVNLNAAKIELQTQMQTKPLLNDARAELEAIASILNGMQNTEKLLQNLLDKTNQSASDFRELADELDAQTATTMNEAIAVGNTLNTRWDELSTLVQNAMKGTGRSRGASKEAQQTASIWKLDLEWTLGQVEEAKRIFLMEEVRAINSLIEHGIVTTATKWQELSGSVSSEVEQATISAISAYENAKQLASSAGSTGETFIHQLDTRIAILQGEDVPIPIAIENSTNPMNPATPTSGFASPQALITAFNSATDITSFDGTKPVENLNLFYHAEDSDSKQVVSFLNNVIQATGNILIAINDKMGTEAVAQFISSGPTAGSVPVMTIDPTSIVVVGDEGATAREVSGKPVKLRLTAQGWKIILSSKDNPEATMAISMMTEMMSPLINVLNSVTQQINDGQITTVDQINNAMMSAMENMNPF